MSPENWALEEMSGILTSIRVKPATQIFVNGKVEKQIVMKASVLCYRPTNCSPTDAMMRLPAHKPNIFELP